MAQPRALPRRAIEKGPIDHRTPLRNLSGFVEISSETVIATSPQAMAASANPLLAERETRDPTLFCTAFKRSRFYLFSQLQPEDTKGGGDRDVFNEKPTREEQSLALAQPDKTGGASALGKTAVIHTTKGDIVRQFAVTCASLFSAETSFLVAYSPSGSFPTRRRRPSKISARWRAKAFTMASSSIASSRNSCVLALRLPPPSPPLHRFTHCRTSSAMTDAANGRPARRRHRWRLHLGQAVRRRV